MGHGFWRKWKHHHPRLVSILALHVVSFLFSETGELTYKTPSCSPPNQVFSLDSFSYACVSGIPQPECRISIRGWKDNGRIITRNITFPRLDPGHPIEDFKMNKTRFSGQWKDLKSVGFSIARADNGGDMFGGLALDDVEYTITQRGCK